LAYIYNRKLHILRSLLIDTGNGSSCINKSESNLHRWHRLALLNESLRHIVLKANRNL